MASVEINATSIPISVYEEKTKVKSCGEMPNLDGNFLVTVQTTDKAMHTANFSGTLLSPRLVLTAAHVLPKTSVRNHLI